MQEAIDRMETSTERKRAAAVVFVVGLASILLLALAVALNEAGRYGLHGGPASDNGGTPGGGR